MNAAGLWAFPGPGRTQFRRLMVQVTLGDANEHAMKSWAIGKTNHAIAKTT
jgi:hypothetical protein